MKKMFAFYLFVIKAYLKRYIFFSEITCNKLRKCYYLVSSKEGMVATSAKYTFLTRLARRTDRLAQTSEMYCRWRHMQVAFLGKNS